MAGRSHAMLHLNYPEGLRGTSLEAKVLYTRLLCDDALNHAGVLPLRIALWADDIEVSEGDIDKALRELEDKRYAYTDYKTHQVLVRTFIRNDGVADIPNILWAACRAALNLRSRKLRRVLAAELRKLAAKPPDKISEKTGRAYVYPDPHGTAEAIDPGPPDATEGDGRSHPRSHPASHGIPSDPIPRDAGSPGGGGGGGGGGKSPVGENSTSKDSKHTRAKRETAPEGFADFWAAYPRRTAKIAAVKAYTAAVKRGAEPGEILTAARRFAAASAGSESRFVPHPATWLNQGRYDDEPSTQLALVAGGHQQSARPSTTDQRVAAGLALAAKYRALEESHDHQE